MPTLYDSWPKGTFHSGPIANRPTAPLMGNMGHFYWSTDLVSVSGGQTLYEVVLEGGVLVWKVIGGAGSSTATAMKYFVNNTPSSSPQPLCLYTTITSAIAAAVADGHSASNPAVIWVCPGTYAANITMVSGISIQGMVTNFQRPNSGGFVAGTAVDIVGIITCSSAGEYAIADVMVSGQVLVSGAAAVFLALNNVYLNQQAEGLGALSPLSITNINATVDITNASFQSVIVPTVPVVSVSAAASVRGFNLLISNNDETAGIAISSVGGDIQIRDSNILGQIVANAGSMTLRDTYVKLAGGVAFTLSNSAVVEVYDGIIEDSASDAATGAGTLRTINCSFPNGTTGQAAATTSTTRYVNRQFTEIVLVFEILTATVTTLADLYPIDTTPTGTGAGTRVVNLPALNRVPLGTRLTFQKVIQSLSDVAITPAGGDTVDGIAGPVTLGAGFLAGVTLQAGTTDWRKVAEVTN